MFNLSLMMRNRPGNSGPEVDYYYRRPGGVDRYLRPDGTSFYLRP